MTFLNPAMLFGILAVALPIAIHLLSRPRVREFRWAATRFLLASMKKNSRRLQVEDLLLLIVRCLIVALLVLLFARPAWLISSLGLGPRTVPSTTVILLDNSASMGQTDSIRSRFDLGKERATETLSKLLPGSTAALYLVSNHTRALVAKPTADISLLHRQLDLATLSDAGTDLYTGIRVAADVLKASGRGECKIIIFTDSQIPAWGNLSKILQLQEDNKDKFSIQASVLGNSGEDNLAVSALDMVGKVAAVNQPIHCSITVTNWGRKTATKITVKLAADDGNPQDQTTIEQIEPGASRVVSLTVRFRQPGYHSITATIPPDRLLSDNQRSTVLQVIQQIRALVVDGESDRDGLFLKEALAPVAPSKRPDYYLKVSSARPSELDAADLGKNDIIFLSNVAKLSVRSSENLNRYVNAGGALVVFPGPATDLGFYNTDPNFSPLLPAALNPPVDAPANKKYETWQSAPYDHPIASLWNNPDFGSLNTVRFTRFFPLTPRPAVGTNPSPAHVVIKYANGDPAAVEQAVGKGHVIVFGSTGTTAWGTLPIHPAFIPLLARVVAFATSKSDETLNLNPGDSFAYEVASDDEGRDFSIQRPDEKNPRPIGKVEFGEHSGMIRYGDTDNAGVYRVFIGDDATPKVLFAVQGDPAESNLQQEPKAEIDTLLNPAPVIVHDEATTPKADKAASSSSAPGAEFWLPLAIALFALVVLDTAMAHLFSQAK